MCGLRTGPGCPALTSPLRARPCTGPKGCTEHAPRGAQAPACHTSLVQLNNLSPKGLYHATPCLQEVVTMGITYEGNYSFAYTDGGEVHTELGEGRG